MQCYESQFNGPASLASPLVVITLIAVSRPASLLEFAVYPTSITTAGEAWLGPPAANGVTATGATSLQAIDPADPAASTTLLSGAFAGTQPTAPANPYRRYTYTVSPACGRIWGWDSGELIIPTGGQLVLWLATGQATLRGYVKVAEGG